MACFSNSVILYYKVFPRVGFVFFDKYIGDIGQIAAVFEKNYAPATREKSKSSSIYLSNIFYIMLTKTNLPSCAVRKRSIYLRVMFLCFQKELRRIFAAFLRILFDLLSMRLSPYFLAGERRPWDSSLQHRDEKYVPHVQQAYAPGSSCGS